MVRTQRSLRNKTQQKKVANGAKKAMWHNMVPIDDVLMKKKARKQKEVSRTCS